MPKAIPTAACVKYMMASMRAVVVTPFAHQSGNLLGIGPDAWAPLTFRVFAGANTQNHRIRIQPNTVFFRSSVQRYAMASP
jgi:hypothetical protein